MPDAKLAIPKLRESIVAVMKLRQTKPETVKKGTVRPAQFEIGWGSGFCVLADKYVVTAFHLLNNGKPREQTAKYYALTVPGNANPLFYFPVISFPLERQDLDIAILEIGPCPTADVHLPPLPVTFAAQADGTQVLTMGFPAPEVMALNVLTKASLQLNTIWPILFLSTNSMLAGITVKAVDRLQRLQMSRQSFRLCSTTGMYRGRAVSCLVLGEAFRSRRLRLS